MSEVFLWILMQGKFRKAVRKRASTLLVILYKNVSCLNTIKSFVPTELHQTSFAFSTD